MKLALRTIRGPPPYAVRFTSLWYRLCFHWLVGVEFMLCAAFAGLFLQNRYRAEGVKFPTIVLAMEAVICPVLSISNPRNPRHFEAIEGGRKRGSDTFTHKNSVSCI